MNWVGRDPHDGGSRLVHCFGPREPDDFAPIQAAILGLAPAVGAGACADPPHLTKTWGELDGRSLVLMVQGLDGHAFEVVRSDPLAEALTRILAERPVMLLVWVDVPLQDPAADLPSVGLHHLWTGVAPVCAGRTAPSEARGLHAATVRRGAVA